MARECSVCTYKLKYCICTNKRASGDALRDQMRPLHSPTRKSRREAIKEHREACKAQGWRPR